MGSLVTHRASEASDGRTPATVTLVHDFGDLALPDLRWETQPHPVGGPDDPGGEEARLAGTLRLGPMTFYVELVEVGYTEDGCQEFVAEQGVDLDECDRTCGPDIHRAIGGAVETFLWQGREYALVVMPYGN